MSGLHIHAGNRVERLVDVLSSIVSTPLADPLAPEVILVQSKGMERWLVRELASRQGIWANGRFPFPNGVVTELFEAAGCRAVGAELFTPETLTWRIMALLPGLLHRPGFESLRNYLGDDTFNLKGLQLCGRIADTFDQYTLYRPEMVLSWESGAETDDWQPQLWRELVRGQGTAHRAALRRQFFSRIKAGGLEASGLPERICIFGIPAMPPFHLEIFSSIASRIDVHLFFMNPSVEYWGDIVSRKELARLKLRTRKGGQGEIHYETGNPLLASMGRLGRDFFELLLGASGTEGEGHFEDPGEASMLEGLQSDILLLRERGRDGARTPVHPSDRSIRIHSVHGPMREMEVLHDQLLELFRADPALEPHDVVVMTPDIEGYAPYITAVFGAGAGSGPSIPFSLADRPASADSPVIRLFLDILAMSGSRFGAGEVASLLESPVLRERFGFTSSDVEQILGWISDVRIRWGIDAEDRGRFGLPTFGDNSWKAGLDRLLLGYAMSGDGETLYKGVLPAEGVEGSRAQLLGRFVAFAGTLFDAVRALDTPRTPADWSDHLAAALPRFVDGDAAEYGRDFHELSSRIARLKEVARSARFDAPVAIDVVRHHLERQFGESRAVRGFLAGGVTFCEMLPMRSIPFRAVALVGLNSGVYPRQSRPPGFDLIAKSPRPGDRSLRDEDRYLFLESLLSARRWLSISYVGQSIVDNKEIPPSVLVSELIDYLEQGFAPPDGVRRLEDHLVVRHPLQPFSPDYFEEKRGLFSYSVENLEALRARGTVAENRPFIGEPLPDPPAASRHVSVAEFKRFFRSPAEYFLRNRLGIHLPEEEDRAQDREPFAVEGLERYLLVQRLSERMISGGALEPLYPSIRGGGMLPPGAPGDLAWRKAAEEAEAFARSVASRLTSGALPPLDVDLSLGPFRLSGRIDDIRSDIMLRYRCASLKPRDRLTGWIDHLILSATRTAGYPAETILLGKDGEEVRFTAVDDPAAPLTGLLSIYWQGLSEPIPFFPASAYEYAKASATGSPAGEALSAALKAWRSSPFARGEGDDRWLAMAFPRLPDPVGAPRFASIALDVFSPLLDNQKAR
ncbi:MAG TPA: exodeoxyribonuclease V subunit gamma [Candidatus Deferrimicrobiaceae bacterium]|jgi:exodeoxyribonuclease V gamma subunit